MKTKEPFKIDGVVILYFPKEETFSQNIPSYINSLNRLYIIDNSGNGIDLSMQTKVQNQYKNVEFINTESNYGIAKSLNIAAKKAIDNNADWLLTMDQDSFFPDNAISNLVDSIPAILDEFPKSAIISPLHVLKNHKDEQLRSRFEKVKISMTSGNLLNLKFYELSGPFIEKLFIDYVDHEYCLRINSMGYQVVRNNEVKLFHHLGDFSTYHFLGITVTTSNHNSLRRYYISRNRLYTIFKYFSLDRAYFFFEMKSAFIEILKILLFEERKITKTAYVFLGIYHAAIGKYGPLPKSIESIPK